MANSILGGKPMHRDRVRRHVGLAEGDNGEQFLRHELDAIARELFDRDESGTISDVRRDILEYVAATDPDFKLRDEYDDGSCPLTFPALLALERVLDVQDGDAA